MNKTKRNIILGIAALLIVSVITVASVMGIEKKKAKDKTENPAVEATTAKEGKDNENIEGEGKTTENSDKTDKKTTETSNNGKTGKTTEASNSGKNDKTTEHSNSSGGGSTSANNNNNGSSSGGGSTPTTSSNSGGNGGTSTTEAPKPSSTTEAPKPSTTEKPKVWHEPVYEDVWVVDYPAWDEDVVEYHAICNQCGFDMTAKGVDWGTHCNSTLNPDGSLNCWNYSTGVPVVVNTIHHKEEGHYEKKLVKDGYWE